MEEKFNLKVKNMEEKKVIGIALVLAVMAALILNIGTPVSADSLTLNITEPAEPVNVNSAFSITATVDQTTDDLNAVDQDNNWGFGPSAFSLTGPTATRPVWLVEWKVSIPTNVNFILIHADKSNSNIADARSMKLKILDFDTNAILFISDNNSGPTAAPDAILDDLNYYFNTQIPAGNYWLLFDLNVGWRVQDVNNGGRVQVSRNCTDITLADCIDVPSPASARVGFAIYTSTGGVTTIGITDANVEANFDDNAFTGMPFNAVTSRYEYFNQGENSGDFNFGIRANKSGFSESTQEGSIMVQPDLTESLIVTNLDNAEFVVDQNRISLNIAVGTRPFMEIKVENIISNAFAVKYRAFDPAYLFDPTNPNLSPESPAIERSIERLFYVYTKSSESETVVFNDSITFGQPVQKIWDVNAERYNFTFNRLIAGNETQIYLLDYKKPMIAVKSLTETDLFITNNTVTKEIIDGRSVDVFMLHQYSRLVVETTREFPSLASDETATTSYVLQFTATASNNLDITIGGVTKTITGTPTTYAFDLNGGDLNIISEIPSTITTLKIEAFSISERGFFTKNMKIVKENGLPLSVIIDNNIAFQVVEEGQFFRVQTELYEKGIRDGDDLNLIIIEAAVFDLDDSNIVYRKEINIDTEDFQNEVVISVDEIIRGIITTSTTIPILSPLRIRVKACGKHKIEGTTVVNCYAEQESQDLRLRQFPFDSSQFFIDVFVTENLVGEPIAGEINIETDFLETIQYVILSVYEVGETPNTSDFNLTLYKDIDFGCIADFCRIPFESEDWVFEKETDYLVQVTLKVKTSELDFENSLLNVIYFLESFRLGYKEATLFFFNDSRDQDEYQDHEKVPLILRIRDNLNLPTRDDLNIILRVWDLGTSDFNGGGDAEDTFEDIRFHWNFYNYDKNTGMNSYAFIHRFREEGGKLTNANFYRVVAIISDHSGKREDIANITISTKGQTGGYDDDNNGFQQDNELSFSINNSASIDAPTMDQNGLVGFTCMSPQNEGAANALRQTPLIRFLDTAADLLENQIFTRIVLGPIGGPAVGQTRIFSSIVTDLLSKDCHIMWVDRGHYVDQIKIFIYNDYSDLTETTDEYKSFMEVTIPFEKLILNDGFDALIKAVSDAPRTCRQDFANDSFGRYLCALSSIGNLQFQDAIEFDIDILDLITQGEDLNVQKTINPKTRYLKFQIDNIRPINLIDYEEAGISFNRIPQDKIFKHLVKERNLDISDTGKAKITIYQNGEVIDIIEVENRLIDRMVFEDTIDLNGIAVTTTTVNLRVDLRFNEGRNSLEPRTEIFKEQVIMVKPSKPLFTALGECFSFENAPKCFIGFFSTPEILVSTILLVIIVFTIIFLLLARTKVVQEAGKAVVVNVQRAAKRIRKR